MDNKSNKNKNNKIHKHIEFVNHPYDIDIGSIVYYFHNGNNWLVIPGNVFDIIPVIPVVIRDIVTDVTTNMFIVKCPVTGVVTIVNMHVDDWKIDDKGLVLINKQDYRVSDLEKSYGSVYFNNFRVCLGQCVDAKYLKLNDDKDFKLDKSVINSDSLASCIRYKNKDDEIRLTGLIGSFESINNYLSKNSRETDMRRAAIIPCYKSFIKAKNMKVIQLK